MAGKVDQPNVLNTKKTNFAEWYIQVVRAAGVVDQRYPIKGCDVLMPLGASALKKMTGFLEEKLRGIGNKEVLFPLFIPNSYFSKESRHIKGFEEEVYHITHAGANKLDERLIVRPTSETGMYPMFSLWIRSYKDLPLKVFQTVSVFRYETKMTKPLIRTREVSFFNESHTAHRSWKDAEEEIKKAIKVYSDYFSNDLCLPFIMLKRPESDKFPGAVYSLAFDVIMPDGKDLQIGTVHNLGDNFAKAFEIKCTDDNGKEVFVNQTCYGISARSLGAVIGIHGDDKGLVFPPSIAPIKVVVIPIPVGDEKDVVMHEAEQVYARLRKEFGQDVHFDDRDQSVGSKFYDWELKGVPVRVELGPKDIAKHCVTLVRRDTGKKFVISQNNFVEYVKELLDRIQREMRKNAQKEHDKRIVFASSIEEIKNAVDNKKFARFPWCGSLDCAAEIEKTVNTPFIGYEEGALEHKKCIDCGSEAKHMAYIGRKY